MSTAQHSSSSRTWFVRFDGELSDTIAAKDAASALQAACASLQYSDYSDCDASDPDLVLVEVEVLDPSTGEEDCCTLNLRPSA